MTRTVLSGTLLVAIGVAAGAFLASRGGRVRPVRTDELVGRSVPLSGQSLGADHPEGGAGVATAVMQRRLDRLADTVARAANDRRRLEERVEALATQIAALRGEAPPASAPDPSPPPAEPMQAAPDRVAPSVQMSATERALVAAGVTVETATAIKRRRDDLELAEISLRDRAAREEWLDTPRFKEQLAEIDRQRTSIRDEIGDDAYDRYLAALGHPNRVRVDEVLIDSPAAQAGLQVGDVVLQYGDARIFAPKELVAETRGGTLGETVQLEILRNGARLAIAVPRGPLGLRIAASQADPGQG